MSDTVCAVATPPGTGAIAIVRASGSKSGALARRLFRPNGGDPEQASAPQLPDRYATYGKILDEFGTPIDTGIAIFFRAPHSYTGEDALELHVHGSPIVAREVMRAMIACGARAAGPGEFTRRAFLNGKIDLHAASAVADLIAAESRSAARAALANLGGGLANEVRALRLQLSKLLEELAGAIDFPEEVPDPPVEALMEKLGALQRALERLRTDGEAGRIVREGLTVAIVGPPNAGKSSLLNALLGEDRALVSEIAGTTRDTVEESIAINGVLVRLVDTAGIRAHAERLESAGIERSRRALAAARVALVVLDGSTPVSAEAHALLEETRDRERIVFANKADLGDTGLLEIQRLAADGVAPTVHGSLFDRTTLDVLREHIAHVGWGGVVPDLERPYLASAREFDAAAEAEEALAHAHRILRRGDPVDIVAGDLQRAFAALGHVTGETATEELLDGIFARFCIGK